MNQTTPLLRDKLAWDGKKLVVTDAAVISKIRRKALSASTSKSMQSCAARWVGERLLRNEIEDPFAPAPLGTSAHSIMEDLFDEEVYERNERTLRLAEALTIRDADVMWPDAEAEPDGARALTRINRRRWIEDVKTAYEGLFVIEDPKTIEVYARELQIDGLTINGVPTNGFIDRVRYGVNKRGKEGLVAEDYKTGKVPTKFHLRYGDDHGDQLRVYAAALKEKTGEMPVGATVLYTKFGEARDVDLSQGAMSKTLKTFELSWKRHNRYMETREFPTKVSALCGWCPLINACPVAKEEGKSVSEKVADQMHSATHLGIPALRPGASVAPMASTEDTIVAHHGQDVAFYMPDPFSYGIPDEEMAEVERASELAAHMYGSGENPIVSSDKDYAMTRKITEGKPWEPYTVEGELNPISYAAIGLFGTAELAVEALHRAGLPISGTNVKALASTFQHIIAEAQEHWTGSTSASDGANSRMRGAIRTVLATLPMPFGEDAAAWDAWVAGAIRRCKSITAVALHLFSEERPDAPWEALANVTPGSAPVAVAAAAPAPKEAAKAAPKAAEKAEPVPVAEEPAEAPAEPAETPVETPAAEPRRVVRKTATKTSALADDLDFLPDSFATDADVFA
ncbi:PD-(D/E)XK nuclease family protein [Paeniglutamicibacter antarcticus]|uniref:PD-(D/E)XK nuclease family protein n=1 Tax=Arthrobacter terrae TaxID=2935737 RepID=A0A931G9H5_9MICC|nr:PD-(D/E)XK nuclease family protein [Arthrobacter terrae]MBG0738702.1 PD-(D/E)XK nuclease family protein [Arthrobacter terrae]